MPATLVTGMNWDLYPLRRLAAMLAMLAVVVLTGCAHTPRIARPAEVHRLQQALVSLHPDVHEEEADRVAQAAYELPRALAEQYRVVRPALFHNFLVNTGHRERGLCYEWAEDMLAEFETFELQSLELRWGIARAETSREHNSLVVTARGQPFEQGIVLDAWRRGGWLVWAPVPLDRYPWVEGELYPAPVAVTQ